MTTWYLRASQGHLLKNVCVRANKVDSHKRNFPRIFSLPRWSMLRRSAAKPSHPNGPGFGFEEGRRHPGDGGVGAATGPAVGHEWRPRHSGQRDGVVRWPVSSVTGRSPRARNFCRVLLSSHCRCWSSLGICRFQELGSGRSTEDAIFLSRRTLEQRLLT